MAASAGMAESGHGSSVMESELEAPMPRSPPVNGGVSEWEKTPLHDSFSAKTVEKVARVITDKVLAEQELMMDELKVRAQSTQSDLKTAQAQLAEADAKIKSLKKESKLKDTQVTKLQRETNALRKQNEAMEQERLRSVEAGAHAATDPDAPEKAEEIEKLKQGAAATVAEQMSPAHLEVPVSSPHKRPYSDLEEGDVITLGDRAYSVSPATTKGSAAIKTVEKAWSTNPINIRTLEEHGYFVVIEYDPTEMDVSRDEQPPMSLESWVLKLDQADLGTGNNRQVTEYTFSDVTLTPDATVTLWQSQAALEKNAPDDDENYHCMWEGLEVGMDKEYELTLFDSDGEVASSVTWPPKTTTSSSAAFTPTPKRLRSEEENDDMQTDDNAVNQSCLVM